MEQTGHQQVLHHCGIYLVRRQRLQPGRNGEVHWTRMSVSRSHLKSIPARVTLKNGRYTVRGAAWGAPITRVEVRFDQGPWTVATIDQGQQYEFAWKFWDIDWNSPSPGSHMITSRAIDRDGNVQPAPSDWQIAKSEPTGRATVRLPEPFESDAKRRIIAPGIKG